MALSLAQYGMPVSGSMPQVNPFEPFCRVSVGSNLSFTRTMVAFLPTACGAAVMALVMNAASSLGISEETIWAESAVGTENATDAKMWSRFMAALLSLATGVLSVRFHTKLSTEFH